MTNFALKMLMQAAHRQARIWIDNGYTDSYFIALSVAMKKEWAELKERARIRAAQEERRAEKKRNSERPAQHSRSGYSSRRVMPLSVAQRDDLSYGRAWVCGDRDIETKGAMPEWEGQLVCYVYA